MPALADPEFAAGIRRHAENLVRRSRGLPGTPIFLCFFCLFRLDWLIGCVDGEEPTAARVNGGREEWTRRNGVPHDEAQRDEGMEISDG